MGRRTTSEVARWFRSPTRLAGCALAVAIARPQDRSLVVSSPVVRFEEEVIFAALRFPSTLSEASTVRAPRIVLDAGAQVTYAANSSVRNQTVDAPLHLSGPVTFRNDNSWTHEAHMLRLLGPLHGSEGVTIEGESDGGVSLHADSSATLRGEIRVASGNLVLKTLGAEGSPDGRVVLERGQVLVFCGSLRRAVEVTGSARLLIGGACTGEGELTLAPGAALELNSGGGNPVRWRGRITGPGSVVVRGGAGTLVSSPIRLEGTDQNLATGSWRIAQGTLSLAKPAGVSALSGAISVGGEALAVLTWENDDQLADDVALSLGGSARAELRTEGHHETLGTLRITGDAALVLGEGRDEVSFAASSHVPWAEHGEWILEGFEERGEGGAAGDLVRVGQDRGGLSPAQLARIGFRDPVGRAPGLYGALQGEDGRLLLGPLLEPPVGAPFEIDSAADAERERRFASQGRRELAAADGPLRDGDRISVFGDSITWQHGYLGRIERAVAEAVPMAEREVRFSNRGVNGGGIHQVLDGADSGALENGRPGGGTSVAQAPLDAILDAERPRVVVLFIGINDVNWRGTTEEDYESGLRRFAAQVRAAKASLVLATPFLLGERPDGSNRIDPAIDRFAAIVRRVAQDENAVCVDLRQHALDWLRNHNRRLHLDGRLSFEDQGLLTYDGIHPSDLGNELLADWIAAGILAAR